MRVAVYGGSFNPPHVAHAMVASWLLWTRRADRVWLVPVFRHAFEGLHDKSLAPFELRLSWCRALAAEVVPAEDPRVEVLDIESHLPAPSYTIDTLRALSVASPGVDLFPVVGADVLSQLPRWREWPTLQERFPPLVVGRAGYPSPADSLSFPDVSSSAIRQRLLAGAPVDHLVPASVLAAVQAADPQRLWGAPPERR